MCAFVTLWGGWWGRSKTSDDAGRLMVVLGPGRRISVSICTFVLVKQVSISVSICNFVLVKQIYLVILTSQPPTVMLSRDCTKKESVFVLLY